MKRNKKQSVTNINNEKSVKNSCRDCKSKKADIGFDDETESDS